MKTHSCDICSNLLFYLNLDEDVMLNVLHSTQACLGKFELTQPPFTFKFVKDGTEAGCTFMQWIKKEFNDIIHDERIDNFESISVSPWSITGKHRSIYFETRITNSDHTIHDMINTGPLYLITEADDPLATIVLSRPIQQDCNQSATFDKARAWIQNCLSNHQHLETRDDHLYMPSRLLEITIGSRASINVKLNCKVAPFTPYIALSYCWGSTQMQKTTAQSVEERKQNISHKTLPKTIQDAIVVTQKLGYQFLWVDSLCIIQDDEEDKNSAIAEMHKIYSHAVVTIAASNAMSADEGFLKERGESVHANAVRLHALARNDCIGQIILLWKLESEFAKEPLNDRGWALQESLLSTRVLEFNSREIRFRCPYNSEKLLTDGWVPYSEASNSVQSTNISILNSARIISTNLVNSYTIRQLSDPTDRPLAISGIADTLARLDKGRYHTYMCGLWGSEFPNNLLWYSGITSRDYQIRNRHLPTWSWTAINLPTDMLHVDERNQDYTFHAEVTSHYAELVAKDAAYGAVKNATITIRGPLLQVSCRWGTENSKPYPKIRVGEHELIERVCRQMFDAPKHDFPPGAEEWPLTLMLFASKADEDEVRRWVGLILCSRGSEEGLKQYTRVGAFELSRHVWYMLLHPEDTSEMALMNIFTQLSRTEPETIVLY